MTHRSLLVAGAAVALCFVAGCMMQPEMADSELLSAGKADETPRFTLNAENALHRYRLPCESDQGCRFELTVAVERTDWLREQPPGVVHLSTVTATAPDGSLVYEAAIRELRLEDGGGHRAEHGRAEFRIPEGETILAFALAEGAEEVRHYLNVASYPIAQPDTQALCRDTCGLRQLQGCLPAAVIDACATGCEVSSQWAIEQFTECAIRTDVCDPGAGCMDFIPGIAPTYNDSCETIDEQPACAPSYRCVNADFCVRELW